MTRHGLNRRPGVLGRASALTGTALLAAALLAWSPAPASGWNQGSAEATLWQLMNGARVNNGLRAVQQHATLVSLARWRSKDQVQRNYFDHTILGTSYQVYHWYDQNGLQYRWGGENIGWNNGYADADSPVAIHEGFMNSPGHRANILEPSWTHGGVGAYAADNVNFLGKVRSPRFYTELFMQASSGAAPPPRPRRPRATLRRRAAVRGRPHQRPPAPPPRCSALMRRPPHSLARRSMAARSLPRRTPHSRWMRRRRWCGCRPSTVFLGSGFSSSTR